MIKVIATCNVKPDAIDTFKELTAGMVDHSRREDGCISYELFQDTDKETVFVFIEEWESPAHLEAHAKAAEGTDLLPKLGATFTSEMEMQVLNLIK